MSKNILILLIFLKINFFGQKTIEKVEIKKLTDTIDYIYLSSIKGYKLTKVLNGNSQININCLKDLFFYTKLDSISYKNHKFADGSTFMSNDTMITISWFTLKQLKCFSTKCLHGIVIGKVKLNRKNNVIVVDRAMCQVDNEVQRIYFKVLKFSEFEIILKDIQSKPFNRTYYFRKNY